MDAKKFDKGKPRLDLLPLQPLIEITRVLEFGAEKYGVGNWMGGMQWSRLISAALRHILAFNAGEEADKESGISHLAHAACCLLFLLEYRSSNKGSDDRWQVSSNKDIKSNGP